MPDAVPKKDRHKIAVVPRAELKTYIAGAFDFFCGPVVKPAARPVVNPLVGPVAKRA